MYEFKFHRPTTVRQAAGLLARQEEAKLLAGGHTLVPTMKLRLAGPKHIVDMSQIEGLSGIEMKGRSLSIGALTRHVDVATSPIVKENIPALAELASVIGDPAVRHRGTIGGSIANNDPNADYPAACLGLGATIITNKRRILADEFFKGLFETALEPVFCTRKRNCVCWLLSVPEPASCTFRLPVPGVLVGPWGVLVREGVIVGP